MKLVSTSIMLLLVAMAAQRVQDYVSVVETSNRLVLNRLAIKMLLVVCTTILKSV